MEPSRHDDREASVPAEPYELFAIKYAHHVSRRSAVFLGGDPHDGPMPMDYFVWLAVGNGRKILIDTGFKKAVGERRGREWLCCPSEAINLLGVSAEEITDVIMTHLHFDHAGNLDKFPNSRIHIQDREMRFATSQHMGIDHASFGKSFEADDIVQMVKGVFTRRVAFHDGDMDLGRGVGLYLLGGHTPGTQVVRVWTRRGWVLLVSDASHYYANINEGRPFYIYYDLADLFDGYRRIRRLSTTLDHIIPGHDPLVMEQYPAPGPKAEGVAVRLDVAPKFSAMSEAAIY